MSNNLSTYYLPNGSRIQLNANSKFGEINYKPDGSIDLKGFENVSIFGSDKNDKMRIMGSNNITVNGGNGNDDITLIDTENSTVNGGKGNDNIRNIHGRNNNIYGNKGYDTIRNYDSFGGNTNAESIFSNPHRNYGHHRHKHPHHMNGAGHHSHGHPHHMSGDGHRPYPWEQPPRNPFKAHDGR